MPTQSPLADPPAGGDRRFHRALLRLVRPGPERRAFESGEVDAILDPASGGAILLPEALRAVIRHEAANGAAPVDSLQVRALLDALPAQIGVLDATGVLLLANQAWRDGAGVAEGAEFTAPCEMERHADGLAISAGVRQVLAAERELFCYERATGPAADRRWLLVSAAAVTDGGAARAVVTLEDISERMRGERLLGLEHAVALCLADAASADAALTGVIRAMCESQGWDCGRYFRLDAASQMLSLAASWGVATPAVGRFLEKSRGMALRVDAGLKGRVCQSGEPLWLPGGRRRAYLARSALAPETELHGAFVIPVVAQGVVTGVLAFTAATVQAPDDRMLRVVRSIGAQLGRFLERQQALDTLRASEARFRRLTEIACDWHWEADARFRLTRVTGCSIAGAGEMLGKAYWELPNLAPDETDWVAHRAQLEARWSFCDFEFAAVDPDGQVGYYCISGDALYDGAGAFTGYCGTGLAITERKQAALMLRARLLSPLAPGGSDAH